MTRASVTEYVAAVRARYGRAGTAQRQGPGEFIRDHLQDPQTGGRD